MSDLLQCLRESTRSLHGELESHAVMQRILGGSLSLTHYCLYLRNLHPIYSALEQALSARGDDPALQLFARPSLFRSEAIACDLHTLVGLDWAALNVMPSALAYAARLLELSNFEPALLGAHAYVRYLGDLSGGRLVRTRVATALALGDPPDGGAGLAFYTFDVPPDALARQMRAGLQHLPLATEDIAGFVAEAKASFERHRTLFDELELSAAHLPPPNWRASR